MSSINSLAAQLFSPRAALQNQLVSQAASGQIKTEDVDALTKALDAIDGTLKSDGAAARQGHSGPPKPGEIEDKVSALVDDQVKSGALTDDQADELKGVFSAMMAQGGAQGAHKSGGCGGAGGPPPGPPPSGGAGDATTSTDAAGSSDSDINSIIATFLEKLAEAAQSQSGYAGDGAPSASATTQSVVVDVTA